MRSLAGLGLHPSVDFQNNYLLNAVAEAYHRDFKEDLPRQTLVTSNGEDVTDEVYRAYEWLREHTF